MIILIGSAQLFKDYFSRRRRWLHVRCRRKKFTFAISYPDEFLLSLALTDGCYGCFHSVTHIRLTMKKPIFVYAKFYML